MIDEIAGWIVLILFLAAVAGIVIGQLVMWRQDDRAIYRLIEFKRKAREGN